MEKVRNKILTIDDDQRMLDLIKYNLSKRGYEVITARGGEEGLRLAKEHREARVILLDIMMPGMTGYEVVRELRVDERTKNIPIIMLTGEGDPQSLEKTFELGVADYIVKPFDPATLIEKITKDLG